jgi:hypothetical protein
LAKEHPDVLEHAYDVGRCSIELGLTANHAHRPVAAIARYDRAAAILEDVLGRGYGGVRNALLFARIDRATTRALRGDHSQEIADVEIIARKQELSSAHFYDVACVFSQASADAENSVRPSLSSMLMSMLSNTQKDWDALMTSLAGEWRTAWMDLADQIFAAEETIWSSDLSDGGSASLKRGSLLQPCNG